MKNATNKKRHEESDEARDEIRNAKKFDEPSAGVTIGKLYTNDKLNNVPDDVFLKPSFSNNA